MISIVRRLSVMLLWCTALVCDVAAVTVYVATRDITQTPATITATARRVDGNDPSARELQLRVNGSTDVDLGEGTWEITTTSDRFWSAPAFTSVTQTATLKLWPRGSIHGTLGSTAPASGELLVSFTPTAENDEPAGAIACPFSDRTWSCALPATTLDLRLALTGFATEFRWGVKVLEEPVAIGRLDLTPGSSVFGKVQFVAREKAELRNAEISLQPRNADPRSRTRRYTTRPDARGFFQVRGLAAGEYALNAQLGELVSESRDVLIIAQTNASLKEPLVLAKPGRVDVRIHPPLDPQQKPWQVRLSAAQHGGGHYDIVGDSLASATGEWSHSRILPGTYSLTIRQEDGGVWHEEEWTLTGIERDRSIDVELRGQMVRGTVALGDRPLQARVHFGGENGRAIVADEKGRFAGMVPLLKNHEATVLVTSTTPEVKRTLKMKGDRSPDGDLEFRIELPATAILGRTINEDGSPEPSAIVTLQTPTATEQVFSREDGSFEVAGFEPGRYRLQAEAFQKASDVVWVEASLDATTVTDVVLRAREQVRGRITMRGVPVVGAAVHAMARDTKMILGENVVSDAAGRFLATLPPGTRTYDIIVIPRGFYVTGARITKDPEQPDLRIGVGQDGGSLTVDAPDDDAMLLLGYAGGEFSLEWLAWQTEGSVSRAGGRRHLTIPSLEPGPYTVCREKKCAAVYVPRLASASVTVD